MIKNNSKKIINYIKKLLENDYFVLPNLYYNFYISSNNSKENKEILEKFENSEYGIMSCVYCLGEGWDFPQLDAVAFAENMSSNIRILQSSLRASRKDKNNIDKKSKIILPILNKDNWLNNSENNDFKRIREIIYQIGLEDESINQKIKVHKINVNKHDYNSKQNDKSKVVNEIGIYNDKLTELLKLRTKKNRTWSKLSKSKKNNCRKRNNV